MPAGCTRFRSRREALQAASHLEACPGRTTCNGRHLREARHLRVPKNRVDTKVASNKLGCPKMIRGIFHLVTLYPIPEIRRITMHLIAPAELSRVGGKREQGVPRQASGFKTGSSLEDCSHSWLLLLPWRRRLGTERGKQSSLCLIPGSILQCRNKGHCHDDEESHLHSDA